MIFGFRGWEITEKGLIRIKSSLPTEWKSLTIKGFLKNVKSKD